MGTFQRIRSRLSVKNAVLALLSTGMAAAIAVGCSPPEEGITFSPPGGTYGAPVFVTISTIGTVGLGTGPIHKDIYFSADGSDPTVDDCDPYDGQPVEVDSTAELRAIYTKQGGFVSGVFAAQYVIGGGGGGGTTYANVDALEHWLIIEATTTNWLTCELNSPACTLPGTGNVILCEGRKCFPWVVRQFDAAGNVTGYVKFGNGAVDLGAGTAETIIEYNNFKVSSDVALMMNILDTYDPNNGSGSTAPSGGDGFNPGAHENIQNPTAVLYNWLNLMVSTLEPSPGAPFEYIVSGTIVGVFDIFSQDGYQTTTQGLGQPIVITNNTPGATYSTATLNDSTIVQGSTGLKVSGFFSIECTGATCGAGPQVYIAPTWTLLEAGNSIEDSCPDPFFLITSTERGGDCMTRSNSTNPQPGVPEPVGLVKCEPNGGMPETQHWQITESNCSGTGVCDDTNLTKFKVTSLDGADCLTRIEPPLIINPATLLYGWTACNPSNLPSQHFTFQQDTFANRTRIRSAASGQCIEVDIYTRLANNQCNFNYLGERFGLNPDGYPAIYPCELDGSCP